MSVLAFSLAGSISASLGAPDLRPQPPSPDFMKRMMREARREFGRASQPVPMEESSDDLETTEARSRQAERILKRSVRGVIGDRLEPLLRSLPAFESLLKPRDLSIAGAEREPPPVAGAGPSTAPPASAVSGSLGFRLDAHPRLLFRGRFHDVRGVLELPLLDREIRLSVDRPIGSLGTATLRGGVSGERGEWVTVSIDLRF